MFAKPTELRLELTDLERQVLDRAHRVFGDGLTIDEYAVRLLRFALSIPPTAERTLALSPIFTLVPLPGYEELLEDYD